MNPQSIEDIKSITNDPAVVTTYDGTVEYVNDMFCQVFKFDEAEIVGENITKIIPLHLHDAHNIGVARFVKTKKSQILNQTLTLAAVDSEGDQFDALHHIIAEQINNEYYFGAIIIKSTN